MIKTIKDSYVAKLNTYKDACKFIDSKYSKYRFIDRTLKKISLLIFNSKNYYVIDGKLLSSAESKEYFFNTEKSRKIEVLSLKDYFHIKEEEDSLLNDTSFRKYKNNLFKKLLRGRGMHSLTIRKSYEKQKDKVISRDRRTNQQQKEERISQAFERISTEAQNSHYAIKYLGGDLLNASKHIFKQYKKFRKRFPYG